MAALRRTAAGIRMLSVIGIAIGIGIGVGVAGGSDTKESMAIAIPTPKACPRGGLGGRISIFNVQYPMIKGTAGHLGAVAYRADVCRPGR